MNAIESSAGLFNTSVTPFPPPSSIGAQGTTRPLPAAGAASFDAPIGPDSFSRPKTVAPSLRNAPPVRAGGQGTTYSPPVEGAYITSAQTAEQLDIWCEEGRMDFSYKNVWQVISSLKSAVQTAGVNKVITADEETSMLARLLIAGMDLTNGSQRISANTVESVFARINNISRELALKTASRNRAPSSSEIPTAQEESASATMPLIKPGEGQASPVSLGTSASSSAARLTGEKAKLVYQLFLEHRDDKPYRKLWILLDYAAMDIDFAVEQGSLEEDVGSAMMDSLLSVTDIILGKAPSPFNSPKETRAALGELLYNCSYAVLAKVHMQKGWPV